MTFTEQIPALLVVVPFFVSVLMLLISYISQIFMRWLALLTTIFQSSIALMALFISLDQGLIIYAFGGWAPPWGIAFSIDPISALIVLTTNILFFLAVLFGSAYLHGMHWLRSGCYYSLFFLMVSGMSGMLISADLFNIFVFMEVSALATYVLIAFAGARANFSAFRYLIIGSVGAKFYLLAVAWMYSLTGSLSFVDVGQRLQPHSESWSMLVIISCLLVGFGMKMAIFPLHGWLPDAHTYAPATISAMISGVMIKVPAFVMFKIFIVVIGIDNVFVIDLWTLIAYLSAVGIIAGSVMAILQTDCKRMLAYSSVGQIGYVLLGLSIGTTYALLGGLLHIISHAVMKSCLFFIAGAVKWRKGSTAIANFRGLALSMPWTMAMFTIAALSMIGLPPTAGFFSKWYLIRGMIDADKVIFIVVIIVSSLLNAIYFMRIIEKIYFKQEHKRSVNEVQVIPQKVNLFMPNKFRFKFELPFTMLLPIILMGSGILVIGIWQEPIVRQVLLAGLEVLLNAY